MQGDSRHRHQQQLGHAGKSSNNSHIKGKRNSRVNNNSSSTCNSMDVSKLQGVPGTARTSVTAGTQATAGEQATAGAQATALPPRKFRANSSAYCRKNIDISTVNKNRIRQQLKGIVQPFELGFVTRLIRYAVKFCMAGN